MERLLRAIAAGYDAGGQKNGLLFSIGLLVKDRDDVPARVDLRVDHHREPAREMRRILELYKPMIAYITERCSNPNLGNPEDWLRKNLSKEKFEKYRQEYLLGMTPKDTGW